MVRFPRFHVLALAALTVAVVCMTAAAQPPEGGRGQGRGQGGGRGPGGFGGGGPGMMGQFGRGGGSLIGLLQIREVREELKVSDEQIGKLTRLREDLDAARRDGGGFDLRALRDLSESERGAKMREFQQEREKQNKETEGKLRGILTGEQFKRLKQIELQQQGTAALMRPDIGQALGITDDQRAQMTAIQDKMRGMFENYREKSEDERAALRDKMPKMREDSEKALMAVLTDDQKAKLKEVMGKPFDMPRREFGRGGPGGGRFGPGGGGDRGGRPGGDRGGRGGGDRGGDRGGEQRRRRPQA